jgi:hypothetical protein
MATGGAERLAERVSDVQLQETMVPPVLGGGSQIIRTPTVTVTPKLDPSRTMRALEWHGKKSVRMGTRPAPAITDPVRGGAALPGHLACCGLLPRRWDSGGGPRWGPCSAWLLSRLLPWLPLNPPPKEDVLLRVTSTAICGSDLHLYLNQVPGMHAGDVLGHEFMGVVEEAGPGVTSVKPGACVAVWGWWWRRGAGYPPAGTMPMPQWPAQRRAQPRGCARVRLLHAAVLTSRLALKPCLPPLQQQVPQQLQMSSSPACRPCRRPRGGVL